MRRYIDIFRWKEALFFCWFSIMGLFVVKEKVIQQPYIAVLMLLSLYIVNLWGLFTNDYAEKNIEINVYEYIVINIVLIMLSSIIILWVSIRAFLIIIGILFMYFLYSFPSLYFKSNILISNLIHFFSAVLFVSLPLVSYQVNLSASMCFIIIMGFLFVGAHIKHEMIDYEEDLLLGYRTVPVLMGQKRSFILGNVFFLIVMIFLMIMKNSAWFRLCVALFISIYIAASFWVYKKLDKYRIRKVYQLLYRLMFTFILMLYFV